MGFANYQVIVKDRSRNNLGDNLVQFDKTPKNFGTIPG